jgi:predicted component of type VI protein secretion system
MSAIEELRWHEDEALTGRLRQLPEIGANVPELSHLAKIELRSDGESLSEHFFGADRIIVGRARDNEIYIQSKYVSRHHAQIISDDSGCTIEDLNSTNGVYVDDRRVKKYRLRDGDMVTVGIHQLIYTDLRQVEDSSDSAAGGNKA